MTTHSSIALSIDPGIRNVAFAFINTVTDEFISSSCFDCGTLNKDNWNSFIKSLRNNIKLTRAIIPCNNIISHIIIEKQKEHPYTEISGMILVFVLEEYEKFFQNPPYITWVDPRAVSKKMKLNPFHDRMSKKQNTILIASRYFNQPAYELTDHEADCLINYLYFKEK